MKISGIIQSDALVVGPVNERKSLDFNIYILDSDAVNDDLPGYEEGTVHKCSYWKLSAASAIVVGTKAQFNCYMAVNIDGYCDDEHMGHLVLMINTIVLHDCLKL